MRTIRIGVFETNSSSVHSLTMCSQEDYDKFLAGELYRYKDELVSEEKIKEKFEEQKDKRWGTQDYEKFKEEAIEERTFATSDNFCHEEYEKFSYSYTTKSGDKVVAFGYSGESR